MTLVFMFPGQSSRYPEMIKKLVGQHAANADLLVRASEILGRNLCRHFHPDNPTQFLRNRDIQIGMFLANHMFLQLAMIAGLRPSLSLGLSLGEWNHVVEIGAVGFDEALLAVQARGEAYDRGPRGWMAALQPISAEELEPHLRWARRWGTAELVCYNSPRQQVVAGDRRAVASLIRALDEACGTHAVVIERRVPMHASTFASVGAAFDRHLATMILRRPHRPYFPNCLGEPVRAVAPDRMRRLLSQQVHRPVRWQTSIDWITSRHPDAVLVEVGPKRVLTDLLHHKWQGSRPRYALDTTGDLHAHIAEVTGQITAGLRGVA